MARQQEAGPDRRRSSIVLVEPRDSAEHGQYCPYLRVVSGATLHLVEPMGFRPTERNLKRAGCDYWSDVDDRAPRPARKHSSMPTAKMSCTYSPAIAIAFTLKSAMAR